VAAVIWHWIIRVKKAVAMSLPHRIFHNINDCAAYDLMLDNLGEWRYSSIYSLTSALDGGEWSASRPGHFTPRERAPGAHWIGE